MGNETAPGEQQRRKALGSRKADHGWRCGVRNESRMRHERNANITLGDGGGVSASRRRNDAVNRQRDRSPAPLHDVPR